MIWIKMCNSLTPSHPGFYCNNGKLILQPHTTEEQVTNQASIHMHYDCQTVVVWYATFMLQLTLYLHAVKPVHGACFSFLFRSSRLSVFGVPVCRPPAVCTRGPTGPLGSGQPMHDTLPTPSSSSLPGSTSMSHGATTSLALRSINFALKGTSISWSPGQNKN